MTTQTFSRCAVPPDDMRIFCAIRHANDLKQFYGGLWSANFYPALRELGHELVESQVDLLPTSRFMGIADGFTREELEVRARTTEQILAEVRASHQRTPLDLFLSYFYNSHFDPAGVDELHRLGIPSVNFYCNSVHQFGQVAAIAAKVDFAWHAERDARAQYLAVGAKPVWVQLGADPKVYYPRAGVARQPKACFIGQRYADRDRWLTTLIKAGVPVDIYGSGWGADEILSVEPGAPEAVYLGRRRSTPGRMASYFERIRSEITSNGPIRGTVRLSRQAAYRRETRRLGPSLQPRAKGQAGDLSTAMSAYELVLNFSNVWTDGQPGSPLIPHVRLRDFEAPMCRTCYLTGHTEEITEFYEVGKEIETYRTKDELVDKSRFLLSHPDAAESLREAGYQRALCDHTWVRRFEELFRKTGLMA